MKKHLNRVYVKKNKHINGYQNLQQPNALYVSEPGFYMLISKSRLSTAKRFTKWIYEDLLPTIRKYGKYKQKKEYENEKAEVKSKITKLKKEEKLVDEEIKERWFSNYCD